MKKIILLMTFTISLLYLPVSANTPTGTLNWDGIGDNKTNCPSSTSHGSTHFGVIRNTDTTVNENGSSTCDRHLYYVNDSIGSMRNKNQHYICPNGKRAISIQRYNGATAVPNGSTWNRYTITCRSWDDTNPVISRTLYQPSSEVWVNSDRNTGASCTDTGRNGSTVTGSGCGTIQRRLQTTSFTNCSSGGTWTNNASTSHTVANGSVLVNYVCYRVRDVAGNGYVYTPVTAVKIDKQNPTIAVVISGGTSINDTWTKLDVTTTATCDDGTNPVSGCATIQKRILGVNTACNSTGSWSNGSTHSHTTLPGTVKREYACYRVRDNVNNGYIYSTVRTIKIDKEIPILTDVTNNVPTNLLANSAYSYQITVSDSGGSPINLVRYESEDHDDETSHPVNNIISSPWRFTWNLRNVDLDRISPGGYRVYSHRLRRICDEADNCWAGSNYKYHNVYANTTTSINSSVITNQLSGNILADGTTKNITVQLLDQYNNGIVPASGIGRNIDINIAANNQLYLDQYLNSGNGALFAGGTSNATDALSMGVGVKNLDDRTSSNGRYTIPFYVYAPTSNIDDRVRGVASITGITYDIDATTVIETGDRPQNQGISGFTNTPISAAPLYYTSMSGSLAQQGFIEGAIQDLDIYVGNRGVTTYSPSLRVEFGDVDVGDNNIANARYGFTIDGTSISEGPQASWSNTTQVSNSLTDYTTLGNTFMIQDGSVTSQTFSYLASIVKHNVRTGTAQKTVIYPSDVYGKDTYIGPAGENNSYQEGARILGITSSSSSQELTNNQFSGDIRIIGQLTKSTLRRDVAKNVFEIIKNIPESATNTTNGAGSVGNLGSVTAWTSGSNDGMRIYGNQVLFFRGQNVTIAADTIQGNKTLLVEDGDVYISGNITGAGILGIIALGGDILIDHSVTDIHAILYTDKSIFSTTDGSTRLDGSATAEMLKDQLYIKGSIFSENTIGGSRKTTPECPYYVSTNCTNQSEAQAYDLNYLRRYFIYDASIPKDGIPETPSGNQSPSAVAGGNTEYPVVIEYNPAIQNAPPPFFE